jgi:DNA-binding MarR family transcriptional regulator
METFLLDKESQIILKIINQVSKVPEKELSFSDLQEKLAIRKQTIRSYLTTLLKYCQKNNLDTFKIEDNKFKMSSDTNFNIFDLYHDMTQKSVKYQIMTSILNNPSITFTDLYIDLAVSKSSLSSYIKQLNDYFVYYDCRINFLQKNRIQGEEHQVRFLYYNLLWGLDFDSVIETSPELEAAMALVLEFIPHMTYAALLKTKLNIYIFQVATRNQRFITSADQFILPDSPYIKYRDFFEKLDGINFFKDCPDVMTKRRECRYLYFLFCRANLITLAECRTADIQLSDFTSPSIDYVINKFQEEFNLTLAEHQLKYLHYNLSLLNSSAAIFKGRSKIFGTKEMIKTFNKTKKNTARFIKQFIQDISEDNRTIRRLMCHSPNLGNYYTLLLRSVIEEHYQPIKILAQTNSSNLYREILIAQITSATPFPVTVLTSKELNGERPDGVISNWLPEKKYQDVPFFSISYFYTNWTQSDLTDFLNRLADEKNALLFRKD